MFLVYVVAAVATLLLEVSLAQYSLSISEDQLQSYYSNTAHADLVQGQHVEIVRDGVLLVGDDGSLLLSPVRASGSGDSVLNPDSGSGNGNHDLFQHSLLPSSRLLPPLPADVKTVNFTWVASTMVNYTLRAVQKGGQLSTSGFNVPTTGEIPTSKTALELGVLCLPLSMNTGRVDVNLTTSTAETNHTPSSVSFFLLIACNESDTPPPTTIYPQTSTGQDYASTSVLLSSHLLLTPAPSHPPTSLSSIPTIHSFPQLPTPFLFTPGLSPSPSPSHFPTLTSSSPDLSPSPVLPHSFTPSLSLSRLSALSTSPFSSLPPSLSYSSTLLPSLSYFPSLSTLPLSPPSHFSLLPSLSPSLPLSTPSLSTPSLSTPSLSTPSLSSLPLSPLLSSSPSSSPPTTGTLLSSQLSSTSVSLKLQPTSLVIPTPDSTLSTLIPSSPLSLTHSSVEELPSFSLSVSASVTVSSLDVLLSTVMESGDSGTSVIIVTSGVVMVPSSSVILTEPDPAERDAFKRLLVFVCAPVGGTLLAGILLSCCILLCVKCRARDKKATHTFSDDPLDLVHTVPYSPMAMDDDNSLMKKPPPPLSLWMSLPWGLVSSLPRAIQALIAQLGVDRKSLSIIDTTMRGEYGSVVSGQLNMVRRDVMSGSQSVTIKMLTGLPEGSRRDEVVRFLEASTLMKGIQHRHVLPVLRVSVEDNYAPLVIYPMVEYGDMHRVMKLAANPEHSIVPPVTAKLTLELAIQIATAMSYLANHGIIHPDLALRNCLLDSDCTVKVSDGALAQQFHPECYYTLFGATRPVRWSAVETLQEGLCTVHSNVWSYAVTVWEILTFAEMPYSEVNNNRSILSTIKMGARLPRPPTCPEPMYEMLCSCWNDRGEARPNFTTLLNQLQQLLTQYLHEHTAEPQSVHAQPPSQGQEYSAAIYGKGWSVSRERLAPAGDSPRSRNRFAHRESSHSTSRHVSMASMLSRSSAAEKLSVTFSVLSASDIPSGSNSEEESDFEHGDSLQMPTDRKELHSVLHQVSASFVPSPTEDTQQLPSTHSLEDDTHSSIKTAILSDISSHTLVPPSLPSPVRSPKLSVTAEETTSLASSNPISVTPPPSQTTDTHSKTSTMDLESVSTFMSAPYTSSPLHSTSFLYPTSGSGGYVASSAEDAKRGDHSPLLVDHKAQTQHSPFLSPSQPSAKSTDSGIRSDEDMEVAHSPNAYTQYKPHAAGSNLTTGTQRQGGESRSDIGGETGLSDLSGSLMAAFDSWGSGAK